MIVPTAPPPRSTLYLPPCILCPFLLQPIEMFCREASTMTGQGWSPLLCPTASWWLQWSYCAVAACSAGLSHLQGWRLGIIFRHLESSM